MINGNTLAQAIISGANNLTNNQVLVDNLNVFPVPDGDTGTNMSMTINAAKKHLEDMINPTVESVADTTASALLRGARGNSGVILSLLFRGISKGLKGKTTADAQCIADAFTLGVEAAYKSVMRPTEGTILTVARETAEKAQELCKSTNDILVLFHEMSIQANDTLQRTKEMLPVLKKANVVDAGGKGFALIIEGMLSVVKDNKIIELQSSQPESTSDFAPANTYDLEEHITFTYCTEFIVLKENDNDPLILREKLETLGDSAIVVDDDDIIKVHVHTESPGVALQYGIEYGQITNIKIENMREQFAINKAKAAASANIYDYEPVEPTKPYGFVAIANGFGIQELFKDLGVDTLVSGGQTMNPSTDDILRAIEATPAHTVFVLPNNKNIIMAAEQTVPLSTRKVCVLHTKTIPQGLSAVLAFDETAKTSDNMIAMTKATTSVLTGQITFAARDSEFTGVHVKQGDILAIDNGRISFIDKDVSKALFKLVKTMIKKTEGNFITILYGSDVSDEQAQAAAHLISSKYGDDYEINLINGGQPVYYYIISIE